MRFAGKVAVVTGAANGIGLAIAEKLSDEGAELVVGDIDETRLSELAHAKGWTALGVDVREERDIHALIEQAIHLNGQLDILVNNAGVTLQGKLLDLSVADFDRVIQTNLRSAFIASQAAARHMIERHSGTIVNMSSVTAELALPEQIPYVVSKGGLNMLTKALSISLAPFGIRVNAVGPGTIATELAFRTMPDASARSRILSRTPLGRFGAAQEIASVVAFLASDEASYITGQTVYADGGRLALNLTTEHVSQ